MPRPVSDAIRRLTAVIALAGLIPGAATADKIRNVAGITYFVGDAGPLQGYSNEVVVTTVDSTQSYAIHGFTYDPDTAELVDGVAIELLDASGQVVVASTISGPDTFQSRSAQMKQHRGEFLFTGLSRGWYSLREQDPRFELDDTAPRESPTYSSEAGRPLAANSLSFGAPFQIDGPGLYEVDLPIRPARRAHVDATSTIVLEKHASVHTASPGDIVSYEIRISVLENADSAVVTLVDTLPAGFRYVAGSMRLGDATLTPLVQQNGTSLVANIGSQPAGASLSLAYKVRIGPSAITGQAVNRVTAIGPLTASNIAEAQIKVEAAFATDVITIVGHVSEGECSSAPGERKGAQGVRVLLETGAWTLTDRNGFYHFEGVRPGIHVVQLDTAMLPATLHPAQCDLNNRRSGSAISQFVEARGGSLNRADFHLVREPGEPGADVQTAEPPANLPATTASINPDGLQTARRADVPAAALTGSTWKGDPEWVLPETGYNPSAPALHIAIRHGPQDKVKLTVNGSPVLAATFEGLSPSADRISVTSQWRGVNIVEGDNRLDAVVTRPSGETVSLSRTIHYANTPARVELVSEQSRLAADGATRPVIAVRVLDVSGNPVRKGVGGGITISPPHRLARPEDAQPDLSGTSLDWRVTTDDGIAQIELEPTTSAGWAELTFSLSAGRPSGSAFARQARDQTIKAWLSADRDNWILVGFAAGTVGFNQLSTGAEALPDAGRPQPIVDGQTTFYAKGRVKGDWLLTMAYDSARPASRESLLSVIDPDRYYPLYGDESITAYDAPTSGKLYLRIERQAFYAMFGDFETGFNDSELTRYSRVLNGAQIEAAGNVATVSAFGASIDQTARRDQIAALGLSGPYRLSSNRIVSNTDVIRIETRDRFRSERVLESAQLLRHIDYSIDYASGVLVFRKPVLSADSNGNPRSIIAEYETWGGGVETITAGARVVASLPGDTIQVGVTAITEEIDNRVASMAGVDLTLRTSEATTVRLEGATSDRKDGSGAREAFVAEIQHVSDDKDVTAYFRQIDLDYGLGQAPVGQGGTRKYGVDLRSRIDARHTLSSAAWREDALEEEASRAFVETRLERRDEGYSAYAGMRVAKDERASGSQGASSALLFGGSHTFLDQKLEITEQSEISIGPGQEKSSFPTRHRLGMSYAILEPVRLLASHEYVQSAAHNGRLTQAGFEITPWTGARATTLMKQAVSGDDPARLFAQYGIAQTMPLGDHWTVDATLDSGRMLRDRGVQSGPSVVPSGLPAEDFDAVTAGVDYRDERWAWNARAEYRDTPNDTQRGVIVNAIRNIDKHITTAANMRTFSSAGRQGRDAVHAEARLGLQIRPAASSWTLLERATLIHESQSGGVAPAGGVRLPGIDGRSTRIVNDLAVDYDEGLTGPYRIGLYSGAKYVFERSGQDGTRGLSAMLAVNVRKDILPTLDIGLDIGAHHAVETGELAYLAGPSIGWSPAKNLWLSAGYNFAGFRDRDFEAAGFTRDGAYLTFRYKFDQITSMFARNSGTAS
jgi:uncharacterized repeat protein (TIGR01451 family)